MKEIFKFIAIALVYAIDFIGIIGSIMYLREIPESLGIRCILVFLAMHLLYNVVILGCKYLTDKK